METKEYERPSDKLCVWYSEGAWSNRGGDMDYLA